MIINVSQAFKIQYVFSVFLLLQEIRSLERYIRRLEFQISKVKFWVLDWFFSAVDEVDEKSTRAFVL